MAARPAIAILLNMKYFIYPVKDKFFLNEFGGSYATAGKPGIGVAK